MTSDEFNDLKSMIEKGIYPKLSVNLNRLNGNFATEGWPYYTWKDDRKLLSNNSCYSISDNDIIFNGIIEEFNQNEYCTYFREKNILLDKHKKDSRWFYIHVNIAHDEKRVDDIL